MTQQRQALLAKPRTIIGRQVKQLRSAGLIPGNIYSKGQDSVALSVDAKIFLKIYSQAGETALVDLTVDGESKARPVLIRSVARHPVSGAIVHIDFNQVNLKEKITAMIPVESIGESEAIKNGGVLVLPYSEIEVEALPTELPEKFEVDISKLAAIGDTVTIADLSYDRQAVEIQLAQDDVVATVQAQEEEQVEEVVAEPVEVELTKQGATKEEEEAAAAEAKSE
ncbi:50S ribosomal protein L25 [Candidatus Woesebacteria bacterium]|nr:50S ribosomal protein L25 [Candidatus Woesebacteria bacterium]